MNKDLSFKYIEDFADYIIDRVEDNEELFVAVVGKFETIKSLLKEVMVYDFVDFGIIEIESETIDNYADEFVLSLWMNDGVLEVGCEKLKRDGEYVCPCGDETYLFEDCSSKIIPLCEGFDLYFVNFDEECDCDECCSCDCHCGDREIANVEKTLYTINGRPVSKDEFDKKNKEFYEKHEKSIMNTLNNYRRFMDDFSNIFVRRW